MFKNCDPHVLLGQIIPLKNDPNLLSCAAEASTYGTAGNHLFSTGSVTVQMCISTCSYVHCPTMRPHLANVCYMMGLSVILHDYSPLQCEWECVITILTSMKLILMWDLLILWCLVSLDHLAVHWDSELLFTLSGHSSQSATPNQIWIISLNILQQSIGLLRNYHPLWHHMKYSQVDVW